MSGGIGKVGRVRRHPRSETGQASVEYLLVGLALIAMIVALGALWHAVADGGFSRLAETAASHSAEQVGGVADAVLF